MKKQTALITGLAAGGVGVAAGLLAAVGYLPVWAAELLAVVKSGEEDIPFIGY